MSRTSDGDALVLASRNAKKSREIAELLAPHGLQVVGVADFPDVPEVVEDRDSFAGNAQKKASETARRLGRWVIAEDSGLSVDALGGRPGVYSARYSGEPTGDRDEQDRRNNAKLIAELAGVPPERRTAHYVCHVSVADPTGEVRLDVEATCGGRIVDEPRGHNGFGYDPHFLIPEYHRTFGELSPLVKNHLSHRARALARLVPRLVALWRETGRMAASEAATETVKGES
jgi:XTP/dITP diphosphohydrolase